MPVEFLYEMMDRNLERVAIENIWYAKLTQMVASKNVLFKQTAFAPPTPLGYFCFSMLPSGIGKDKIIRLIDKNLIPFLKPKMNDIIDNYKKDLQSQLYKEAELNSYKNGKLDEKVYRELKREAEAELKKITSCKINIADLTFQGLYKEAEKISKTGYGAICIKNMEFGDLVYSAIKGDSIANDMLKKMKNISDGEVEGRVIQGDDRDTIENMPVIVIFGSDYNLVNKPKEKEFLDRYLDGGMGRRSFFYIVKDFKDINDPIGWEEEEKAQMRALEISAHLETVFDRIPLNMVCEFSNEAKTLLQEFKKQCFADFRKIIKYDEICAKEAMGAYWKVSKLSVPLSILDNPTCNIISAEYVQKAIDFQRRIQPYLSYMLNKRGDTPEDNLKKFLINWATEGGQPLKRKDISKQGFHTGDFKRWFEQESPAVFDEIREETGYIISDYTGFGGNTKAIQVYKK